MENNIEQVVVTAQVAEKVENVKIKDWKFVTKDERENIEYLTQIKELYEKNVEDCRSKTDYVSVVNQITVLRKKEEKELAALRKKKEKELADLTKKQEELAAAALKQAEQEERKRGFCESIDKNNIYYVGNANKYFYFDTYKNIWETLSSEAAYKLFRAYTRQEKALFDEEIANVGHNKLRAVNTFRPHSPEELNLLDRSKWLQPKELEEGEQVDEWIDMLVTSITGENKAAKDHLEQVIAWKYCHPEDYKIPAQSPYGKGGAGKNKFIEMTLAAIFGREQIAVIGTEEAFGNFNGQMIGKTIVFIDEAVSEKSNSESLKRKVMNQTVNINVKHGVQGTFDSTALFFISGNSTCGALKLSGDVTDRRFSVYHNERSMFEIISSKWHVYWNDKDKADPRNKEMKEVYDTNEWRFGDEELVAKWLGYIIAKWIPQMKGAPTAFHDTAYEELVNVNKSDWQEVLERIFDPNQPEMVNVEHITGKDLYEVYCAMTKYPLKNKRFYIEARHWLKKNRPQWEWACITVNKNVGLAKKRTSADAFIKVGAAHTVTGNTDHFYEVDERTGRVTVSWWIDT